MLRELTNYIYGPGGLPIEQIASETPTYYHHDQLGSTRMLTSTTGTSTGKFTYAAYGTLTASSGTQTTPLGFAGQYTNGQSGLQYLRARSYDPVTGQFLSRDPLTAMTRSPYNYASNNPLNGVDPLGPCNAEFWTEGFWTEGNCISESPANPIQYYEREVEAWESGCSYWDSIKYGLVGAGVAAADVAGLDALVAGIARTVGEEAAASVADALSGLSAGNSPNVLVVGSDAELQDIWNSLAAEGKPVQWQNYSGEAVELPDGTMIGIRQTSSSDGPAIDINLPGQDAIKIHVEQ